MNRPIDQRVAQLQLSVSPKFTKADAELLVWGAYLAALLGVVVMWGGL